MASLLICELPAQDFTYTNRNGSITITGYTGPGGAVLIPDNINGLPVTSIGDSAFSNRVSLTSVTIPNTVTNIGFSAFENCTRLAGVYFRGNAPLFETWIRSNPDLPNPTAVLPFSGDTNGTAYRLPGTIGWVLPDGAFPGSGLPGLIELWLPQVQTSDASFGVRSNQFGFNIYWASGMNVVVEASTNLTNPVWYPAQTNTLSSGPLYFSDPQWTNYPGRFYRVRSY